MNENGKKRKDWVKNAAIIFLSVMLVLTFFSNTIMNYSLPEVATQVVTNGPITTKVRGTGPVSVSEPYNITLKESRVIKNVAVKAGDTVEKGAVLFELEDSESTELQEAESALTQLVLDYQKAILNGDTTLNKVKKIEEGQITDMDTMQKKVEGAKNAVKAAEGAVESWTAEVASIQRQIDLLSNEVIDTSSEEETVEKAEKKLDKVQKELDKIGKDIINTAKSKGQGKDVESVSALFYANKTALEEAESALEEAEKQLQNDAENETLKNDKVVKEGIKKSAQDEFDKVKWAESLLEKYENKEAEVAKSQKSLEDAQAKLTKKETEVPNKNEKSDLSNQLTEAQYQLTEATAALTNAQSDQEDVLKLVLEEVDLGGQNDKIREQQEKVEKLRSESVGATIEAPVAGTITTISKSAGESTTPDEALAVIQVADKGFALSISVTEQQAKNVKVGDVAEIQDAWNFEGVTVTLAAIKPDSESGGKNKLLTFDVAGQVQEGQQLNISVGNKSAKYDLIVPTSAIREDKNGKFILVVESKNSALVNRYIAKRVDVEVLAADDTQSAVSGGLYGSEYVITTSTKPVEAGKQIRLAD